VGVKRLQDLVQATHAPTGKPKKRGHYADGGLVTEEEQKRTASFGDAAAAALNPDVQQIPSAPPAAPEPPAPAAALKGESAAAQIPMDSGLQAPKPDGSMDSVFNSDTGRNLQAIANSVGGLGGALPAIARTGGAISTWLGRAGGAAEGAAAATVGAAGTPAMASAIPSGGTEKVANPESSGLVTPDPGSNAAPASSGQAAAVLPTNWDRTGMTNAQVGQANPSGRVRMERLADGSMSFSGGDVSGPVSYVNGQGNALPGAGVDGSGFGGFQVSPGGAQVGLGPNGSYVFSSDGGGANRSQAGAVSGSRQEGQALPESPSLPSGMPPTSQRSPVGMTVEQAQREGLVGPRIGYNPAYDQRLQSPSSAQADQTDVPQLVAPQVANSTNDYAARKRLENLATSASSITNTNRWGGRGAEGSPAARAYRAELANDSALQQAGPGLENTALQGNAGVQRERVQQVGANQREAMRNSVDQGRLAMEQAAAAERRRSQARIEQAQEAMFTASTPEKQRAAQSRLLALMGKGEDLKDRFVTVGGGTYVQDGQTMKEPTSIYDAVNRQWLRPPASSQPSTPPAKDKLINGQIYNLPDGRSMRWNGKAFEQPR